MSFLSFWRHHGTRGVFSSIQEQLSSPTGCTQEDQYWGRLATGGEEDYYWRRLSDNWSMKDVMPSTYLEIHNACYEAYNANPIAFAIIEITTSFVLGKGVSITASEPVVQQILQDFWNDPDNHMDTRVYSLCTELSLYGEQFVRFYINRLNGKVKIRQIDPSIIDQIETDPEDIETPMRFHLRPIGPAVVLPTATDVQRSLNTEGEWLLAGSDVVQFCINKVSNAKRGKSDLATLLPWLRRYKDWLTDRVRINKYKSAFLWDVQLQGADKKAIDRKKMEYAYPPEPGSIIIHNEAEKWSAVRPEINANEAEADGRALKLMLAVGAQLPEHYLSDGNYGNRATAAEMGLPTLLKFQRRQHILRALLRTILDRVILEAQKAHRLSNTLATDYEILFPQIDTADHQTLASATQLLMGGLTQAKQQGWISDETAMRLLFQCLDEEIDLHDERERVWLGDQKRR
ncbi:hypothetical protein [Tengunoibacter tsumagoiensis]|uniref:Phage portal protein n=1 Tax=Tengunoibacter tsumagoiensis TaxID=2014871 RepID=A0A402A2E6_9CHLR|nr:hypothetical protein [Tengunoibacter tsumagoiensis]GCE13317.1 hypothetical protein KTT_31760 [Tengunoibacter tsumagoiensis]